VTRALLRVAFVLALIVVGISSELRLAANGLGCSPWPSCYASAETAAAVRSAGSTSALRLTHRIAASAFALVALALTVAGWRRWSGRQRGLAVALLVLTAVLSWVGRYTPSPWPWVTLVNALGGLALLLLLAWLNDSSHVRFRPNWVWRVLVFALLLQAAVGTLISVRLAGNACTPECTTVWAPGLLALVDPMRIGAASDIGGGLLGAQALHGLHRLGGLGLLLVAAILAARSGTHSARWTIVAALGATVLLGLVLASNDGPATVGALHAMAAGLALSACVAAWRPGARVTS